MLGTSLFTRSRALQGISSELKSELFAGPSTHLQIRTATKRGGGSSKNGRDSAGKRLGVKKYTDQYILPGQIIIRQRGSSFHPGQHVRMGTDKTLYATEPGYVKYYTHDQPFPHRPSFLSTSPSTLSSTSTSSSTLSSSNSSTSSSAREESGSFEINESNSEEYVPSEFSQPPVKRPRGLRQYVGIVRSREDRLPRDEVREGRDRRFWGWPKEVASVTEV